MYKNDPCRSDTKTIVNALRCLANGGIYCEDGIATAVIAEAANRLEEFNEQGKSNDGE